MRGLWLLVFIPTLALAQPRVVTDQDILGVTLIIERGRGAVEMSAAAHIGTDDGQIRSERWNPRDGASAADRATLQACYAIALTQAQARTQLPERVRPTFVPRPTATPRSTASANGRPSSGTFELKVVKN